MILKNESSNMAVAKATIWSLSSALSIGLAGCVTLILTFVLLNTFLMPALMIHLNAGVADAVFVIAITALSGIAGYLTARLFFIEGVYELFKSISWRFRADQGAGSLLLGICATVAMHFLNTGTLPRVTFVNGDRVLLIALLFIGDIVAQPLVEEVYFRGVLFAGLSDRLGQYLSVGIVTIIFILVHPQHHWIVLPIATLLGLMRITTGSVANCFALHAAYNVGVMLWGVR